MTFDTRLPHLGLSRNLTRAAVWSVAHCRTDDPSAAVDDLVASSRLGQNVSSCALFGHMVDLAIQGMVIDSITEHASTLVGAGDTSLVELLNDANYGEELRRAIKQEAGLVTREADKFATMAPEEVLREMTRLAGGAEFSSTIQPLGQEQAIVDILQVAELEKQFANALDLPEAEYRQWLASLEAIRQTNPFVDILNPANQNDVSRTQAMTVRNAIALAGLAIMQDGPDALQSHPDPTTGQPFAYKQTPDGFELESSFQVAEKPLKLSFK